MAGALPGKWTGPGLELPQGRHLLSMDIEVGSSATLELRDGVDILAPVLKSVSIEGAGRLVLEHEVEVESDVRVVSFAVTLPGDEFPPKPTVTVEGVS